MSNIRRPPFKMKKQNLLWTCLITIFLFSLIIEHVSAQEAVVYIDPESHTAPEVGVTFSINVSIANVTNLYAYHLIMWYNTTLLDAVKVELPPNHFLSPSKSSNLFDMSEIDDEYNATHGVVGVLATFVGDETPKNGSGILATVTFNATTPDGPSPLKLYYPGYTYPVKLSDPNASPIPCTAIDSTVEVLPEFGSFVLILSILTMTLLVILLKAKWAPEEKNTS